MLSGSSDIVFWGAVSLNFSNLTSGFPISDQRLNQTAYKNASFSVQLLPDITWDQINVLSIWDIASTSDFGHVTLPRNESDLVSNMVYTVFDNCKNFSNNYRVRWNLNVEENWIEIGLKAGAPTTYYMAFGWANLNRTNELMSEADVTVASFTEEGRPFVDDFYITAYSEYSLGGNATLRNATETIYSGEPEAEGVVANPHELISVPDRNTPDQVYYQSLYQEKMGWKVQDFDGALSDMYNTSVHLDDQVTFFWTLSEDSITIAALGVNKSGYLAIGFGNGMVNSYAYVGWIGDTGKWHLNTYCIDGKYPLNIHPTNENLTHSYGQWVQSGLMNISVRKTCILSVQVLLIRGSSEAEQGLQPVKAVHGFMLFLSWGILIPGGILAARYLKHVKGDGWYQIHIYLQYSGLAIIILGVLFAVAELRGFYVSSLHVQLGIVAIVSASVQPMNAYLRPEKPANGEDASTKRLINLGVFPCNYWQRCHSRRNCSTFHWNEAFRRKI
ncbi:hypothetical protein GOBAR_DD22267 [Gossypium barbadense]|nr:hypothetical protein GOBAR_DD22267 [Gossypium barbadense]